MQLQSLITIKRANRLNQRLTALTAHSLSDQLPSIWSANCLDQNGSHHSPWLDTVGLICPFCYKFDLPPKFVTLPLGFFFEALGPSPCLSCSRVIFGLLWSVLCSSFWVSIPIVPVTFSSSGLLLTFYTDLVSYDLPNHYLTRSMSVVFHLSLVF